MLTLFFCFFLLKPLISVGFQIIPLSINSYGALYCYCFLRWSVILWVWLRTVRFVNSKCLCFLVNLFLFWSDWHLLSKNCGYQFHQERKVFTKKKMHLERFRTCTFNHSTKMCINEISSFYITDRKFSDGIVEKKTFSFYEFISL